MASGLKNNDLFGPYLQIGRSKSPMEIENNLDGKATSLSLSADYRVSKYLSFDVDFLGIDSAYESYYQNGSVNVDATWWGVNATGYYPIGDHFEIF